MRLSLPENVRDVERVLEAHGYTFLRQNGSHRHYRHTVTQHVETFTAGRGGHKVDREYVDNLMRRLRRQEQEQQGQERGQQMNGDKEMIDLGGERRVNAPDFSQMNGHNGSAQQRLVTKHCAGCNGTYPLDHDHFGVNRANKHGFADYCRECAKLLNRGMRIQDVRRIRREQSSLVTAAAVSAKPEVSAAIEQPAPMQPELEVVEPSSVVATAQVRVDVFEVIEVSLGEWFDMGGPSVFRAERFTVLAPNPTHLPPYDDAEAVYALFTDDSRGPGEHVKASMLLWAISVMYGGTAAEVKAIRGRVHF